MGWGDWLKGSGGSESKTKTERSGGTKTTHHLNTKGGSRQNHTHVIVREKGDRKTAHCVPHKNNRKS